MQSYQQTPRPPSRRSSPQKFQRSGPFKSLRHISSGMFNEDRRTLRKVPAIRNGHLRAGQEDPTIPRPKTRKGLSQMLGWKQGRTPTEVAPLPTLLPSFAAEQYHPLTPQTRPRPSAGPDPFMPSAGAVRMIPVRYARPKQAPASARAMMAERHGSNAAGYGQAADSPHGSWRVLRWG